ncbi:Cu(I)-responsive transcriptional regulator [Nitratireductor soli]|uniref:Cu(I)-responsive transcriptional regulator n=1 Tax=Nitratireductor soli TaxID=1670619 RepID=UPI00065E6594|nr:Cu(I)-responsive transcriptional regulator [Nitratireductor soli]
MNIGQASKTSGVSAKMIRYYEATGLIPAADRKSSGYRDYSDTDVHVLRFIRRARDLGFSVAEISDLLGLWRDDTRQSAEVKRLAQGHIDELQKKIKGLQDMAHTLTTLVNACHGDHRPHCPILQGLETDLEDEDLSIQPRRGAVAHPSQRGKAAPALER